MAMISMWGIGLPLAYLFGIHFGLGLMGIWISFIADEWVRGILMYRRWRSRIWIQKGLHKCPKLRYEAGRFMLAKAVFSCHRALTGNVPANR